MTVRFACGHQGDVDPDAEATDVQCRTCGEHRIARVTAPPPRVRGACSSPLKR